MKLRWTTMPVSRGQHGVALSRHKPSLICYYQISGSSRKANVGDTPRWWFPTCKEWTVALRAPAWGQRPDSSHDAPEVRKVLGTHEHKWGVFDCTEVRLHKNTPAVLCLKHAKLQPWQAARSGRSKAWFIKLVDGLSSRQAGSSERCWPRPWAWWQHCHPAVAASRQPFSIFSDEKEQSVHYNPMPRNTGLTLGSLCLGTMSSISKFPAFTWGIYQHECHVFCLFCISQGHCTDFSTPPALWRS